MYKEDVDGWCWGIYIFISKEMYWAVNILKNLIGWVQVFIVKV